MTPEHDDIESTVAAYVLDACDEDERELVRAHVEGCPSCQQLVRRLNQATAALPLASEPVRPPARLRERILAAAVAARPDEEEPPPRRIIPLPSPAASRRAPRWSRLQLLGAAVAAMAVGLAVLAGWNILQATQQPTRYALEGTGSMASAAGTVTSYDRDGISVASFTGMPPLQEGRVYELWLIDAGGRATPGTVFTPRSDGTAQVVVPRPLKDVRQVAVTSEVGPSGTSAPTHKPELASPAGA